ncbi:barwin-like endoglucanase [Heliocybe sulcata]|uniref:Barwin-like endoglucanase n=1 Tax=Heliocybe sulcata TaxID=5364 RepID=A0A5C3MJF3_9AGAM|nr:barwin-like endoglucanase [Heliocybe sulcata]
MNAMLAPVVSVSRAAFVAVLAIFSVALAVSAAPLAERDSFTTGGVATYFYQNGNAGACGQYHSDSAVVAAMDSARYNQGLCGKKVFIQNTKNGKSVTATIADECPTCINSNSIDLSVGAFTQIATEEEGEVPIQWKYV